MFRIGLSWFAPCCWRQLPRRRHRRIAAPARRLPRQLPSWPAAIATRHATPKARRSPTRRFPAARHLRHPAFHRHRAQHHARHVETGIGKLERCRDQAHALLAGMRPDHGRLAGVALAAIMPANFYKALLPDDLDAVIVYLRSLKPLKQRGPRPRLQGAGASRDPYPDAEAGFGKAVAGRSGAARRLSRHHRPLHGMPFHLVARRIGFQVHGLGGGGRACSGRARAHRREHRPAVAPEHHLASDRRHRRLE